MSESTVNPAEGADDISPEIKDLFVDNQSESPAQPDKPEGTGQKNPTEQADTTETEEGKDKKDKEEEAGSSDDDKGEAPAAGEKPADPKDLKPEDQEYVVAGKKYKSFSEAQDAVRRVAGDNTRLSGDNKELLRQLNESTARYQEAIAANKEWQEYFENPDKSPTPPAVKQLVREAIAENKAVEQTAALKVQYEGEIDGLPKEKDFEEVYPVFKDLAEKFGKDINKISPKELYKMARGLVNGNKESQPPAAAAEEDDEEKPAEEHIKKAEKKIASKNAANKVVGGGSGGGSVIPEEVSPEVADYFERH